MSQSDRNVEELVKMLKRGDLKLPELQRGYVWRKSQVVSLLDSVYRKYPSGSILTWKTDQDVHQRDLAFDSASDESKPSELLLDGQQRLTSLRAVLNDEDIVVKDRKRPIRILFNLAHPETSIDTETDENADTDEDGFDDDDSESLASDEENWGDELDQDTFAVASSRLLARDNWVPLSEVLGGTSTRKLIDSAGVKPDDEKTYDLYEARIAKVREIRNYSYRVDTIEEDKPYAEVADIFVRVNSGGTRLRGHDLALAHITATWPGSLQTFEQFQSECENRGYEFGFNILLKTMLYFAIGESRFRHVGQATRPKLEEGWARAVEGLRFGMNVLNSNLMIDNTELLSSHFLAIALAAYGDANGFTAAGKGMSLLERWALLANAKGRYSRGATETVLEQDLTAILRAHPEDALLENLEGQVGGLSISATELTNLSARSPQFRTMFLAFREAGACDWRDRLRISLVHSGGRHRIERHHFFPQKVLRASGRQKGEIDHGANLAFISARTNKWIADRPPSEYVPMLIAERSADEILSELDKQCIPTDPDLWRVENYEVYLVKRRELIADRLNEYINDGHLPVPVSP